MSGPIARPGAPWRRVVTGGLVIGAGPAGLMAAETMARDGLPVIVADQMPSPARKFLMAGKSGLNLTKEESLDDILAACHDLPPPVATAIRAFGPDEVVQWAEGLGQAVFTGSTGRVFPTAMKASPLLRAWLARLGGMGVTLRTRWRWGGWDAAGAAIFDTPDGAQRLTPDVTVLALGGASWPRLGSTGEWAAWLPGTVPFQPANMGVGIDWSDHMAPHLGRPVKAIALAAGALRSRGEIVLSARGLEGGGVYAVSRAVRDGAALTIDLRPDWSLERVRAALQSPARPCQPAQSPAQAAATGSRPNRASQRIRAAVAPRTGPADQGAAGTAHRPAPHRRGDLQRRGATL